METDSYQDLARHLDNLPGGFPPSESCVELRLLRRLFSPEEAELAVHLTLERENARIRIGRFEDIEAWQAVRELTHEVDGRES